jgi:hypothetical protein
MMKYRISYTEEVTKEIEVEADSQILAEERVMNGQDIDFDEAIEQDAQVTRINSSVLVE